MTYITLPFVLKKNSFKYTQLHRGSRSCIYEQRVSEKTRYYEVFLIRLSQEKLLPNGKILPVKEKFPADEDFGTWAWTYPTLQAAQRKFNELEGNSTSLHTEAA